jgi:hypothetical protein
VWFAGFKTRMRAMITGRMVTDRVVMAHQNKAMEGK